MTECFFMEPTDRCSYGLRRYVGSEVAICAGRFGYHNAYTSLGETPAVFEGENDRRTYSVAPKVEDFVGDSRWPLKCDYCDYLFTENDPRQVISNLLYRRQGTEEEFTTRDVPPGAMWDAWWLPWKGPDGRSLTVVCPDGKQWSIDAPAKNCTLPDDREHRCWLRTGDVPKITVGKSGPPGWRTCGAGGGSIDTGTFHR